MTLWLDWGVFLWKRSENDDIIINKENRSLMEVQL
mgnify:CR=1 FL=1